MQVLVTEEAPPFLEHLLINGELDVAIMVSNVLGEPQALVAETLTRTPNRVWLASQPRARRARRGDARRLRAYEQVVLEADRIDDLMRAVWARHRLKPRVMLRTSSLEAVRSLVGAGAGIAVLPDFLYRPWTLDAQHVDARPLRDAVPTVDVGLVWRRGSGLKPVAAEFIEHGARAVALQEDLKPVRAGRGQASGLSIASMDKRAGLPHIARRHAPPIRAVRRWRRR